MNGTPEAACRFAVGAAGLFPHWAQNRSKNGVRRGRFGAKTGPKVSKTDPRTDKNVLAEQVVDRGLAMGSDAAETFVEIWLSTLL